MKLDPNSVPGPSPLVRREDHGTRSSPLNEGKANSRDYFNIKHNALRKPNAEHEPLQKLPSAESADGSGHSSQPNSPHIAYQERGRQLSTELNADLGRKKREHGPNNSINSVANENVRGAWVGDARSKRSGDTEPNGTFMLQEVPKSKKSEKRNSMSDGRPPPMDTSFPTVSATRSAPVTASTQLKEQQVTIPLHESPNSSRSDATFSGSPRDTHGSRSRTSTESHSSPLSTQLKNLPERGDSLTKSGQHPPPRRSGESGTASKLANSITSNMDEHDKPASAPPSTTLPHSGASGSRGAPRIPDLSVAGNSLGTPPHPPLRAKERLMLQQEGSSSDSFVAPRVPPCPPVGAQRPKNEPPSLRNGDGPLSPKLSRNSERGDVFVDEDAAQGNDDPPEQGGFLRRVSQSVRHARSYSDRSGIRLSKEQRWPKSPMIGSHSPSFAQELSSPATTSSPETKEQLDWLKSELRKERQKTVEKEQQVAELEQALDAKSSIKQMNSELREKRSTMVVLDTQKEIVVRELEVLTDHIAEAKKSGEPLDVGKMTNTVLREFAQNLQSLKDSFQPQIEELTQQRNDLRDEVASVNEQKDKSFQEFEQLSVKNAQLADLNNQLVHQIQELYKANAGSAMDIVRSPPNGLGIYQAQSQKDRSITSTDSRDQRPSITESWLTGSTAGQDHPEAESAAYLTAPQVVNIRKAQPKKFNWKKGGQHVAKGVTKGLKGAFSSEGSKSQRDGQYSTEGMPYGAMSQQEHPRTDSYSKSQPQDRGQGFGSLFGNPKSKPQQFKSLANNSHPAVNADGPPRTQPLLFFTSFTRLTN